MEMARLALFYQFPSGIVLQL